MSEQAEIVRRFADLFSREQLDALREAEERDAGDERELLYRLRKTCESGLDLGAAGRARGRAREPAARRAGHVQGRGDAAPERAGAARGAAVVRGSRGARRDPGRGERAVQRRPARAAARRRGARRRVLRHRRCRSSGTRRRRTSRCTSCRRALEAGERRLATASFDGLRGALVRAAARRRAPRRFRRATTPPGCGGSRRSSRPTRRTARPRSACETLEALGFDLNAQPNIKLDLDDRPQKSPRACVIASDPPKVVHLITRAQGGLHDYQAFLHEAGHALHYAGCDPELPYTFRRISRDHALTEIYSYIVEAISREPEWHELYFGLVARAGARERRGDDVPRGAALPPLRGEAALRARLLVAVQRRRRRRRRLRAAADRSDRHSLPPDNYLSDMDAGFYSADYLRAWIRSAQLRSST